jgi:membrane protein implicated in regulation of membrane protease activity
MSSTSMPRWLVAVLAVIGALVLGPPALALLLVAFAFALKLGILALKVGVVVLGIAAIVFVLRAMFASPRSLPRRETSIDELAERLETQEREQRQALDRQLDEALQSQR